MRKKNITNNENQLLLFGKDDWQNFENTKVLKTVTNEERKEMTQISDFLNDINKPFKYNENGNNLHSNNSNERATIHDGIIPGSNLKDGVDITSSEGTVRINEDNAATNFSQNGNRKNINTVSQQNSGGLFEQNGQPHSERLDANRSEGSGMVELNNSSRIERQFNEDIASISTSHSLNNFHRTEVNSPFVNFNKKVNYKNNIAAIQLLVQLKDESRNPTITEQNVLADFVGFGGLKEILLDPNNEGNWKTKADADLKPLVEQVYSAFNSLDPDTSQGLLLAAKRSINSAHYTSFPIINAIWNSVKLAGFKGGEILEPSSGIGNFLAAMPQEIANNSIVSAIEMDKTTGKILQHLFPTADTRITGFEKLNLPENKFDLIISNIPFGDTKLFDPQLSKHKDQRFNNAANNLHNFFFAKSMLLAKPGAMIAFITSRYTLDSTMNDDIKELIKNNCEFVGAIRLPDTAFKANAGTEVVSDIIFLRKFNIGEEKKQQHEFDSNKTIPYTDSNNVTGLMSYNIYFHNNPSHMIGKVEFGGLYSNDQFNLMGNTEINLQAAIEVIAEKIFPNPILKPVLLEESKTEIFRTATEYIKLQQFDDIGNIVNFKDGNYGVISAEFYEDTELFKKAKENGISPYNIRNNNYSSDDVEKLNSIGIELNDFFKRIVEPIRVSKADVPKLQYIEAIRKLTKELIFRESNNSSNFLIEETRDKLNNSYNQFTSHFGNLLNPVNKKVLAFDTDKFLIQSLEIKDKITNKINKADILSFRTIKPKIEIAHTDKIEDAILISLQKYGKLNINFISELMDIPYSEIIKSQIGEETLIFIDEKDQFVYKDEYLSGNVVKKLNIANEKLKETTNYEDANRWTNNIAHLEKVQPIKILATDIYSPLHARWIPSETINQFITEAFKIDSFQLKYSKSADDYHLNIDSSNASVNAFCTKRRKGEWIINHALNGIEPVVTYTIEDLDGKQKTLLDAQDTYFAKEQYRKVKALWDDWKFDNTDRRTNLENIYNNTFNNIVLRQYDGSHLFFDGLMGYNLRPHQSDAIFRNTQCMGGINDHMIGAGKTLVQICTAMELRRLKMANKPCIIGLKSQIPQLYKEFKKAYPLSKILFPTEKDFSKDNRQRLLNNIATNEWDCIILSHDQFSAIRQPIDIQVQLISELTEVIKDEILFSNEKNKKKVLENKLYKYEQKLGLLSDAKKDSQVLDFSQLGIDFLMVDESQEFKNLEFITNKKNVRGLGNPMGSKRAFNMLVACRHLQSVHGGDKGVLFCSGTPLSNSMAELYLLFKYLRPNKMENCGLTSFDRWAGNFANDYSDLEYYMGKFKEVHRFREFANIPELLKMYREIADVRNDTNLTLDKPKINHTLIKLEPSPIQLDKIEELQLYIDSKGNDFALSLGLTAGYDDKKKINSSFAILAINYAKKLSLDPRLINSSFPPGTKLQAAAENIFSIYQNSSSFKGTQLVFCDLGTPKGNNVLENLYNHLENENTPIADMEAIFGLEFYEQKNKPSLNIVKEKIENQLSLLPHEVDMLIQEANASENFNVYAETKKLLMEKGIPSHEIVFIHDYKTRQQKENLFDAVNNGEIRIVLGSTKKLGTGVNVQEKCIAAHHLDINWRPSDMEQRNGRFARQGNWAAKNYNDNLVNAFYYATERTLDASMYNIVSQKAKFIAQIKTTDNQNIRTLKDLEEEIDMGSMAAELSGDPIFKEKASLTKRINELSQLEKSFNQKKFNTQDSIKIAEKLLQYYEINIVAFEKTIPFIEKIPKDEKGNLIFNGNVNGANFDKVSDFSLAIIAEAEIAKKHKSEGAIFQIGELWNFKVMAQVKTHWSNDKTVDRVVISPTGDKISKEETIDTGKELAVGLQIKNTIVNLPSELIRMKNNLINTKKDIDNYINQLNLVFPYKDELLLKQDRLIIVDKTIIETAKAAEEKKKNISNENDVDLNVISDKTDIATAQFLAR